MQMVWPRSAISPDFWAVCPQMTVRPEHCNGHGNCHGGISFSLADSAFAFACNSENQNTLAAGARVDFLAPGQLGDVLRAEARVGFDGAGYDAAWAAREKDSMW